MVEELDPLNIFDAANDQRLALLLATLIALIILLGASIAYRAKRRQNIFFVLFPAILSFCIFIYGDIVRFGGAALYHDSRTKSGPMDPHTLDYEQAKFHTCLVAFRVLALFSAIISLIGVCIHLPNNRAQQVGAGQPEKRSESIDLPD
ncbi:MAG: hypothetical protein AAGA96_18455 [Verrucomicrobiota bacterium]